MHTSSNQHFAHHPVCMTSNPTGTPFTVNGDLWTLNGPSPSKVAQLQYTSLRVKEEVLRLDVSMTHPIRMDVRQGTKQLVHVELWKMARLNYWPDVHTSLWNLSNQDHQNQSLPSNLRKPNPVDLIERGSLRSSYTIFSRYLPSSCRKYCILSIPQL